MRGKLAFAACLSFLWVLNSCSSPGAGEPPPNILLIVADDLGYGHLGCYGQELIRTPNLDRMAAEGIRFTQAYAGASVCAPSRSVLMTGLHTGHTPVRGNSGGIPLVPEDVTVAEVLKEAGYRTGLFGKWGLGEHGTTGVPYRQGFDEFFGWLHQIHAHFYYPEYLWQNDQKFFLEGNDGGSGRYAHDEIVARAIDFIRKPEGPFFAAVTFAIPHYELLVPEDSLAEYRGRFPETPYTGRGRPAGYPSDYGAQATPKAAIAAMITRMDRSVGEILNVLGELGIDDRTVVLFSSDNGASDGPGAADFFDATGGLRGLKGTLYEGGIRVPLTARWNGTIQPGRVSDQPTYFADMMPTLAELARISSPSFVDGISIVPTLVGAAKAGREQEPHQYLYWNNGGQEAARMGNWKMIAGEDIEGIEIYDLGADPAETRNLAPEHPELVARAREIFEEAYMEPRPQVEPPKPEGRQYQ